MSASRENSGSQLPAGELGLPLPINHAPLPRFEYLVDFLESLARINGPGSKMRRRDRINEFIDSWRSDVGDDIYPAFQLILPQTDSDIRQLYNLKETALARILVRTLELNPRSSDALQLLDIRKSTTGIVSRDEGLAAKAEHAVAKRNTQIAYSTWTLDVLIGKLVSLSQGSRQQRIDLLKEMIEEMNAIEMKWVVRIILRHMQLNCSDKTFFQCWHPNAQVLFNVTNNLKVVCNQLWDPSVRLEAADQSIRPLACFKPMRSKFVRGAVADMSQIVQKMHSSGFYIEEKIDGERIQLHWTDHGRKCRYFSRRGKDFTEQYGSDARDPEHRGSLTPHLYYAFNPKVQSCILDGEMAAWDTVNQELCGLGKVREASKASYASQLRPLFMVFDCLHLNGQDLSRQPLRVRKQALERIILPEARDQAKGYVEILPYVSAQSAEQIASVFDHVISQMSEGIVVKDPNSRYVLDGVTDAWLKVKPEFVNGYEGENFDLIVVGGYRGAGKWANRCSSFLCALRDQTKNFSFVSLCRVGSGFCTIIYDLIEDLVKHKWFSQSKPPDWLHVSQERLPDFFIDPKDSVVIEVKATQISDALVNFGADRETYGAGYSLRFPRFVRLRDDKDYSSCLSVGEFLDYCTATNVKKNVRRSQNEGSGALNATARSRKRLKFETEPPMAIKVQSHIFQGLKFYIAGDISLPHDLSKRDFETYVREHGGTTTDSIETGVLVISDKRVPSIMAILSRSEEPILHPSWVFDSILNGRLLPTEPSHFFWGAAQIGRHLVDKHGFPLFRRPSFEDVKRCFSSMNFETLDYNAISADDALRELKAADETSSRGFLFSGTRVFLDSSVANDQLLRRVLRYGGATVLGHCERGVVTHVICDAPSRQGRYLHSTASPFVVTGKWVHSCWRECTLLDEQHYRNGT